jgi:hypothetical protein
LLLLIGVYLRSSAAKLSSFREAGAQPNFHGASKLRRDLGSSETKLAQAIFLANAGDFKSSESRSIGCRRVAANLATCGLFDARLLPDIAKPENFVAYRKRRPERPPAGKIACHTKCS